MSSKSVQTSTDGGKTYQDATTQSLSQAQDVNSGKASSFLSQAGDINDASDPSQNSAPPTDPNAPPDLSAMTNAGSAMNSQTYARSRAATILTSGRGLLGASARTLLGR